MNEQDKIFDEIIKDAGILAIEKMEKKTLEELDQLPKVKFSKKHEQRMKNLFKKARKKARDK